MSQAISDTLFRNPVDLAVTPTEMRRVLLVGSCLLVGWPGILEIASPPCPADYVLFNNASQLGPAPPLPPKAYDFQIIQITLRTVLPENTYFRLNYTDIAAYQALFEAARERMVQSLDAAMRWNRDHGILSFVCNFLVPQQNPMGRLLPRYDLRNMVYFVEKLNEALAEEIATYTNAYLLDFDQIVSTYGRRYYHDDVAWHIGHGGALGDADFERDQERIEQLDRMAETYPVRTGLYINLAWAELVAMYRTIRQIDMVKIVIIDLDDTLWRGVVAELTEITGAAVEGWPLGFAEALGYLKRRGVLLAIVSKNEESRITELWNRLHGNQRLSLDDFVVRKINWRPKADNIEEILQEVNLLPRSAVFIDDNPAERGAVKAAFPDMRVLGPNPYVWRRILLWSAETQVAGITSESAARTQMVQAQVARETQRKRLSRDEFLATLGVEVHLRAIVATEDAGFPRALELINKSNQFNTTGRRWTMQECAAGFDAGLSLFVFEVTDNFTAYGIVGVVVTDGGTLRQFVMSCRVVGLDVETAVIAEILRGMAAAGHQQVVADFVKTDANLLCRDLYARSGFDERDDKWYRAGIAPSAIPAHVKMSVG